MFCVVGLLNPAVPFYYITVYNLFKCVQFRNIHLMAQIMLQIMQDLLLNIMCTLAICAFHISIANVMKTLHARKEKTQLSYTTIDNSCEIQEGMICVLRQQKKKQTTWNTSGNSARVKSRKCCLPYVMWNTRINENQRFHKKHTLLALPNPHIRDY